MVIGQKEMVYTCGDGAKFFSREEAKRHEVQLQVMELIKDSVYGYENSLEKVIEVIVDNFDEIEMIVRDKY